MRLLYVRSSSFRQLLQVLRREFIKEEMGFFLNGLGRWVKYDILHNEELVKEIQIEIATLFLSNIDSYRQENKLSELLHLLATSQLGATLAGHPFHTLEVLRPYYSSHVDPLDHPETEYMILHYFYSYMQQVYMNNSDEINKLAMEMTRELIAQVPNNLNVCRYGIAHDSAMMLYCAEPELFLQPVIGNVLPLHA